MKNIISIVNLKTATTIMEFIHTKKETKRGSVIHIDVNIENTDMYAYNHKANQKL